MFVQSLAAPTDLSRRNVLAEASSDAAMTAAATLRERFRKRFSADARIFRAPGRINLIGEHTDYNDGFVMPAAIGLSCWVAANARADGRLVFHSENLDETFEADLTAANSKPADRWHDYTLGVAVMLERAGLRLTGANLLIQSELPLGGGLSSSAALEVATALALTSLIGRSMNRTQLARLCQQAEHDYAGVRCGIMDQFVALHATRGHALLLDCRSLDFTLLPLPGDVRLVACNTMVKHKLAAGEYNRRRADCEDAVRLFASHLSGVRALRDVSRSQLAEYERKLPDRVFRRARHVVTENARTQDAAAALREGDLERFGRRLGESHTSLREDYEVSCAELDQMVEIANRQRGVHGSRMTGGGFGGCTVSIVDAQFAEEFRGQVASEYERATGLRPQVLILEAAPAAGEVHLS
jgi:galactokinase